MSTETKPEEDPETHSKMNLPGEEPLAKLTTDDDNDNDVVSDASATETDVSLSASQSEPNLEADGQNSFDDQSPPPASNALLEFQSMWEIKKKDLVTRESLSKNKLLDTLLTKTEPLSDMEMALKNKLINDMLNSA